MFVQANVGQFSSVTGVELEFLLFKPSNINEINISSDTPLILREYVQKRTIFKSGLY